MTLLDWSALLGALLVALVLHEPLLLVLTGAVVAIIVLRIARGERIG